MPNGRFRWIASQPLVSTAKRTEAPCIAIKDPTIVRYGGRWHLFCTIRSRVRTHAVEYLTFMDWRKADAAKRHLLDSVNDAYFCAPQVFFFRPHDRWYMVFQSVDKSGAKPFFGPAFSTTADINDPTSWTPQTMMFREKPSGPRAWLDFWVICDDRHAYLFFTSLDGRMWRCRTELGDFPKGWDRPVVALQGYIFEASHTYLLKGTGKYLTVIEAQKGRPGWRYFKAYLADRLDGEWRPLAASAKQPFAGLANVEQPGKRWTDSISHGELLRDGFDERLVVDPKSLRFLFQGVLNRQRAGRKYGEIPWRLGLLEPVALSRP